MIEFGSGFTFQDSSYVATGKEEPVLSLSISWLRRYVHRRILNSRIGLRHDSRCDLTDDVYAVCLPGLHSFAQTDKSIRCW